MIKKTQRQSGGSPDWMVTYGDMMSLLLCFFVILVSMSELKQDRRFKKVMESIRIAFGYEGGIGRVPTTQPPEVSMLDILQNITIPEKIEQDGDAEDPGIQGKRLLVTQVRDSYKISFGGKLKFERFSDRLVEGGEDILAAFADRIKGLTNIIEINGHTTREPLSADCGFQDKDALAFARARTARDVLVKNGVDPRRIELVSVADRQPIYREAYSEDRRSKNRTVEIIVSESIITDLQGKEQTIEETLSHGKRTDQE